MYAVVVDIRVADGRADAFMEHMNRQAQNSLTREPGCRQFDICVSPDDPHDVLLYELYDDRAAFDAHLASDHFAEFDRAVQPLMASKSARFFQRT